MSVINQMLKDLDQRNPDTGTQSTLAQHAVSPHSMLKTILITTILVLLSCLIAFYVWQLNSENSALKAQKINNDMNVSESSKLQENTESSTIETAKAGMTKHSTPVENPLDEPTKLKPTTAPIMSPMTASKNVKKSINSQSVNEVRLAKNSTSNVTPAKRDNRIVEQDNISPETEHVNHVDSKSQITVNTASKVITKAAVKTTPQSMSVSRRQLSAEELAQQKLVHAEKALASKDVSKAEKLLEDVMIITPNDSQARKKLAALWFGRQAYQDAVNLLSQGITLNGKDSSLRQMKARIHLTQGQATAALNTLKPLANLKDEQYQIMLANTAQQAQHSKAAINAYTMLIAMQPDMGRWQLGIAVLYDKNSQFNLAINAYNKALAKNDLSVSSEQFVKERIQAIGQ
jgi:MSHA biogenesis protein MshN